MAEPWNDSNGIKWQLSEQTMEKALKSYGLNYVRQSPTGVNHSDVDFTSSAAYFEQKNWLEPISSQFVTANIKPKFDNSPKDDKPRIVVCSRMHRPAKELCKQLGFSVWEFGKQLVTKRIWKKYSTAQKHHSTSDLWSFIRWIHRKLDELIEKVGGGSKVSTPTVDVAILENGTLTIEDERGDYFLVMIDDVIRPEWPFLGVLKICEYCGKLHYWNGRFCSMKCFHKWGGPKRAHLEKMALACKGGTSS
jgi:hypothetical protein